MKRIPLLIATVLLLAACEKQIELDIEYTEPQVVVMSQNDADNPVSLTLTYSRPVFGTYYVRNGEDYFQQITNATVTLSVNGGNTLTATRNDGTYTFAHTPHSGEQLSLTVNVPGKGNFTATTTVPQAPLVGNITHTIRSNSNESEDMDVSLFIPFTDRGGTTDYYSIIMHQFDTVCYTYYDNDGAVIDQDTLTFADGWFECQDQLIVDDMDYEAVLEGLAPVTVFYGDELLFTDARINGTTHTIELQTYLNLYRYNYEGQNIEGHYNDNYTYVVHTTFHIEVAALSHDHYLFRQTINNYSNDDMIGIFSEPIQIHSNIEGGIGIFGVCSKKTFTCQFDYQP